MKLKNLSLAKTIEEKDMQIEAGKKREKDLKIKASSQRRIQNLMQEKIDWLNKTIVDLQLEMEKNCKNKKRSDSSSTNWVCSKRNQMVYSSIDTKSFIKPKEAFIDLNSEMDLCDKSIFKDTTQLLGMSPLLNSNWSPNKSPNLNKTQRLNLKAYQTENVQNMEGLDTTAN